MSFLKWNMLELNKYASTVGKWVFSLANKSLNKDSRQKFCIFLAQKHNFFFSDCLSKCVVNVTLMIWKCFPQYVIQVAEGLWEESNCGFTLFSSFSLFLSKWNEATQFHFLSLDLQLLGKIRMGTGKIKKQKKRNLNYF